MDVTLLIAFNNYHNYIFIVNTGSAFSPLNCIIKTTGRGKKWI